MESVLHQFLFTEVKHICPQPVTGSVSRLVFTGSIPVLHTNSQRIGACFLLAKKEDLSGLIQVNDDEERKGGQAGRVYGRQL